MCSHRGSLTLSLKLCELPHKCSVFGAKPHDSVARSGFSTRAAATLSPTAHSIPPYEHVASGQEQHLRWNAAADDKREQPSARRKEPTPAAAACGARDVPNTAAAVVAVDVHGVLGDPVIARPRAIAAGASQATTWPSRSTTMAG